MKHFFTAIIALFFAAQLLSAQDFYDIEYEVGAQPIAVFHHLEHGWFDVICLGHDADFDGEYDEGEEAPSWWRVPTPDVPIKFDQLLGGGPEKLRDFEFGWLGVPGMPFRPAIDYSDGNGVMYISQNGRITSYNMYSGEIIDSAIARYDASAVSKRGDELFISVPGDDEDYVVVYDMSASAATQLIKTGYHVQKTIPFEMNQMNYLAILNEGNFGVEGDSHLKIVRQADGGYEPVDDITLGEGGNYMTLSHNGNLLAIVMNGSHELIIFSLDEMAIDKRIALPTDEYDGPRECSFERGSDHVYVSSYSGKNFDVELDTEEIIEIDAKGKSEGIRYWEHITEGIIWCVQFQPGTYTPSNKVIIRAEILGVAQDSENSALNIYPNPASDEFIIESNDIPTGNTQIRIVNNIGEVVHHSEFISNGSLNRRFSAERLGLGAGHYIISISGSGFDYSRSIIINK